MFKKSMFKKSNKMGAKKCRCTQNHIHDSRLEARHCNILHLTKEYSDIKTQVKFSLDSHGKHICNHYMDFTAIDKDGKLTAIESKGFATDLWKLKSKMFVAQYPEYEYVIWKK